MVRFVTNAEAAIHLRLDTGTDDFAWLDMFVPAVSQAILQWLKQDWRAYEVMTDTSGAVITDSQGDPIVMVDSAGDPIVKAVVKAATMLEVAQHYRFRDGSEAADAPSHWGHGYVLGKGATSLLNALRKSTVA